MRFNKLAMGFAIAALAMIAPFANAQVSSTAAPPIVLTYGQAESISVSTSTSSLALAVSGANLVSPSTLVSISWNLASTRTQIWSTVSISGALAGPGGHSIPVTLEHAIIGGVTSTTACSSTVCSFNGSSDYLKSPITNFNSSDSYSLAFEVDGVNFPVDQYSQTVTVSVSAS